MKKLIAEFDRNITLFNFDNKIDELVETFPKEKSVIININFTNDKSIATLYTNPNEKALERKVWKI